MPRKDANVERARQVVVKVYGVATTMPQGQAGCLTRRPNDSEHGNSPRAAPFRGIGALPAEGRGRGGAVVVLRGQESWPHGEGRQRIWQGGTVMVEDAPVNVG